MRQEAELEKHLPGQSEVTKLAHSIYAIFVKLSHLQYAQYGN